MIILDCSGSMSAPPTKIEMAKRAAAAAIDCLRPGTLFAVIRGTSTAQVVYPPGGGLAEATPATCSQARRAVKQLAAAGGTAIGRWLLAARGLLVDHPDAIRHAILLTDGKNEHETATEFADALRACRGHFQCDCRGVGRGWVADELQQIASTLLGTALDIPHTSELVAHFTAMAKEAMARALREASLSIWVPQGARIRSFRQIRPTIEDLTSQGVKLEEQITAFSTGAWRDESRSYHLTVAGLTPFPEAFRPSRVGRVGVSSGGVELASASILAQWTTDPALYTQVSAQVQAGAKQIELMQEVNAGKTALGEHDRARAETHLGRAWLLARELDDQAMVEMVEELVTVVDRERGLVRVRPAVDDYFLEVLQLRSRYTARLEARPDSGPQPPESWKPPAEGRS